MADLPVIKDTSIALSADGVALISYLNLLHYFGHDLIFQSIRPMKGKIVGS
jgi:hypothetical protein